MVWNRLRPRKNFPLTICNNCRCLRRPTAVVSNRLGTRVHGAWFFFIVHYTCSTAKEKNSIPSHGFFFKQFWHVCNSIYILNIASRSCLKWGLGVQTSRHFFRLEKSKYYLIFLLHLKVRQYSIELADKLCIFHLIILYMSVCKYRWTEYNKNYFCTMKEPIIGDEKKYANTFCSRHSVLTSPPPLHQLFT